MGAKKAVKNEGGITRVLLVDDHPIVRQGLGLLLAREPDMMVCARSWSAPTTTPFLPP